MDEFFAAFRAIEIDADQVRQFQQALRAKQYSNGSINRSIASLRRMFSLAQRDGQLRNMPFFPMVIEAKPRQGTLPHDAYIALRKEPPDYLRR